jgi:hypothetical protein
MGRLVLLDVVGRDLRLEVDDLRRVHRLHDRERSLGDEPPQVSLVLMPVEADA